MVQGKSLVPPKYRPMPKDQFYSYLHCFGEDIPFNAGKGKNSRAWDVKVRGKKWVDFTKKHPFEPEKTRIYYCDSEEQAFELEKELLWICRNLLGLWMANATDGGEGASGYKADPLDVLRRAKLHSEFMKGHVVSKDTRESIAKALTGRKRTPASIAKTIAGNTGRKRTPEQCANIKAGKPGPKKGSKMCLNWTEEERVEVYRKRTASRKRNKLLKLQAQITIQGSP